MGPDPYQSPPVNTDFAAYVGFLDTGGTLCLVGGLTEPITLSPFGLMLKQRKVTGSVIGSRSTIIEMLEVSDTFGIAPIIETFPLRDVNAAIDKVRANTIRYRAVLEVR